MILAALLLPMAGPVLAAEVEGRILGPAGVTPITGAVLIFHHLGSGVSRTSEPTASDGTYLVFDLPPGQYDVAVRTGRGLWLADQTLSFRDDEAKTLSFSLRERAYWEESGKMPQQTIPLDQEVVGVAVLLESEDRAVPGHPGRGRKIFTGAGIGVGVLLVALLAGGSSNNGDEASPFVPVP